MNNSPYNLCCNERNSDQFYRDLSELADITYARFMKKLPVVLEEIALLRSIQGDERTREEYMIDLLTLAMVWSEYLGGSQWSSPLVMKIQEKLYQIRTAYPALKSAADTVRGGVSGLFIYPFVGTAPKSSSICMENLDRLIEWLRCTGEFGDEVKRFSLWRDYFVQKGGLVYPDILHTSLEIYSQFSRDARRLIGRYTTNVTSFRKALPFSDRWREDALFRNKSEVVYHINMLASEIVSRGFKKRFSTTSRRTVLVPACMSERGEKCRRREDGLDITCTSCSSSCNIAVVDQLCRERGHSLNIVPHSSSFTKWLTRWENSTECGLIAVACPLNIVVGGYQMRELNIPSQCLMLDYCGCAKHWGPESVPTAVNVDRLLTFL